MINKIAKRLMLMRLAADYTANGTQEVNVKFTENVLQGIAQKTWRVLTNSNHLATLRDIFEKKYDNYRKKLNKTEEAYQFPNAPAFKLADQFLTPEVCDSIIDTFLVIDNKKNQRIPYNILDREYHAVYEHARRIWLTSKFQVMSTNNIRRNLENMHLEDNSYSGLRLHKDMAKYAEQIEWFKQIDTFVWNYVKDQLKQAIKDKSNSSNAKAFVFMPHAQATGYLPDNSDKEREETGRFPDMYDADVWNRGKADYEKRLVTKEQICAMIPRIWAYYDKYLTFDPNAKYTDDEIKARFGLLTDTAQYPHMLNDICDKLLGQDAAHSDLAIDDSTWDAIIDAVCSCNFINGEKIIAELEAKNFDLVTLLSRASYSVLKNALKIIFEPKITFYKNKIKEFKSAYYADQKEKAKNQTERERVEMEQSMEDIDNKFMTDSERFTNIQEGIQQQVSQMSRLRPKTQPDDYDSVW